MCQKLLPILGELFGALPSSFGGTGLNNPCQLRKSLTLWLKIYIISFVFGAWLSLVEHLPWEQGVAGSNPAAPTKYNEHCLVHCGCSLVVKPQPSKLMLWVRFPSPAPIGLVAQ